MSFLRTLSLMLLGCCFVIGCSGDETPPADPPADSEHDDAEAGSGSSGEHTDAEGSESK